MNRDCPLKHAAMKQPSIASAKNLSQGWACPEASAKIVLTASGTTALGSLLCYFLVKYMVKLLIS